MKPIWRFDPVDWVLHVHVPGPTACGCEYLSVRLPCIYGQQPDYKLVHRDDLPRILSNIRHVSAELPGQIADHVRKCKEVDDA